jgi:hypothetical protein
MYAGNQGSRQGALAFIGLSPRFDGRAAQAQA